MDFLEEFANITKHLDHEISSNKGKQMLFKKILALNTNIVPNEPVYNYISPDYKRLCLRTNDDFGFLNNIPPSFYQLLLKSKIENGNQPILIMDHFKKCIFPEKEAFPGYYDGQDIAWFFLLNDRFKPQFRDILRGIMSEDGNKKIDEKKYDLMINYDFGKEDVEEIQQEIGKMINSMEIDTSGMDIFLKNDKDLDCPNLVRTVEKYDHLGKSNSLLLESEAQPKNIVLNKDFDDSPTFSEKEHRNNPILKEYKEKNLLSHQFPSKKAMKQMILLEILYPLKDQEILGKRQQEMIPLEREITPDEWNYLLKIVDYSKKDDLITFMDNHPKIKSLYNIYNCVVPIQHKTYPEFFKDVLTFYRTKGFEKNKGLNQRLSTFYKLCPDVDDSIVDFLIKI